MKGHKEMGRSGGGAIVVLIVGALLLFFLAERSGNLGKDKKSSAPPREEMRASPGGFLEKLIGEDRSDHLNRKDREELNNLLDKVGE